MGRLVRNLLVGLLAVLALAVVMFSFVLGSFYRNANRSDWPRSGEIALERLPEKHVREREGRQTEAAEALGMGSPKQILLATCTSTLPTRRMQ